MQKFVTKEKQEGRPGNVGSEIQERSPPKKKTEPGEKSIIDNNRIGIDEI